MFRLTMPEGLVLLLIAAVAFAFVVWRYMPANGHDRLAGRSGGKVSTVTDIARACHEINRAYCAGLGDKSQLAWDDAPEWQRTSAIAGVWFHIQNPDASPSTSHDNWLAQKRAEGWRYGPVKDVEAREHPCFVPFDELPRTQQAKDFLFAATVRQFRQFL